MFLDGGIRFTDISEVIENTLAAHTPVKDPDLDDIMDTTGWAAEYALGLGRALA